VLVGGTGDDKIGGDGLANTLGGGDGRDTIEGGSGDDYLEGNAGADVLDGSSGNDLISGGGGNDRIVGGSGRDNTFGGAGNDRMLDADRFGDAVDGGQGTDFAQADQRDTLTGIDRLRVIVNALTRLRFCSADGVMEFEAKDDAASAPPGFMPWFDVPGRRTAGATVAFGHWSTLGWLSRPDLLSTDTGCVWGGCLSAARIGPTLAQRKHIEVHCAQSQKPG